jgi:cytochrome P450 / NADPH-cytochrome P450 reductase
MTYAAGDYLAILPTNPIQSVKRVLKHFNLSEEVSQNPGR